MHAKDIFVHTYMVSLTNSILWNNLLLGLNVFEGPGSFPPGRIMFLGIYVNKIQ